MGCQASIPEGDVRAVAGQSERFLSRQRKQKQSSSHKKNSDTKDIPKLDSSGRMTAEEVARRTNSSIYNKIVMLGEKDNPIRLQYAHWTQRGYYPDDPHKENQDECEVHLNFAREERGAFFGVYDGHGVEGHSCAQYAKKKLPKMVAKYVTRARVKKYKDILEEQNSTTQKAFDPQKWPLLSKEEYEACCRKAFLECDQSMHDVDGVEDKLSGTTAISVCFHGNMMVVCNVGDSRAIMGICREGNVGHRGLNECEEEKTEVGANDNSASLNYGQILAIPLSRDQTPYRKDERERVKHCGASVLSIDQKEGMVEIHDNWGDLSYGEEHVDIGGDPPRIWVEGKDYPGTSFTRSLGDRLAKEIGVIAEPEILSIRELTSNDQILVIASDGIFEFLTNKEVIRMCQNCPTPLHACEQLVTAAYNKWMVYENRTDDITVIVCFLNCDRESQTGDPSGTTQELISLTSNSANEK